MFFSDRVLTLANWVEHLRGLLTLSESIPAGGGRNVIFDVPPTSRAPGPSVVRRAPSRAPPLPARGAVHSESDG